MSTTNLDIEEIFTNYELLDTVATKASIADAVDTTGIVDNDSFTVNGVTITAVGALGGVGADEIQFVRGSATIARNKIRLAINGTEDADVSYGANLDAAEGVDGVKASNGTGANLVSLEHETAGANSLTLTNVTNTPVTAAGLTGDTGVAATGAIKIPLSDLNITSNDLTVAESQDDTGDYRKLIYHIIRKYQEYLASQESLASITISAGGAGYEVDDELTISGGSPTTAATAKVSAVDGSGAITGVTITNDGGSGYSSAPAITGATGSSAATLVGVLTDNLPDKLTITKGSLVENTTTGIISRQYNVTFGFDEQGLEIASD